MKAGTAVLVVALIVVALFASYAWFSLSELRKRYVALEGSYSQLKTRVQNLQAEYGALMTKYRHAVSAKEALESKYETLKRNYAGLQSEYGKLREWLLGNISMFTALVSQYKKKVANLSYENEELRKKVNSYETLVGALKSKVKSYKNYVNEVNAYVFLTSANQTVKDEFLRKAVQEASAISKEIAGNPITGTFRWILLNTYYQYDPAVPTYMSGMADNIWKLPSETVSQEGGDCEDLALLAYAILRNKGVKAWLIFWWGTGSGHAAVVAKYGGRWYLIDPAGSWLNGYTIFLEIVVRGSFGREYYVWVPMLSVTPSEKRWLMSEGFAKVVWWDLVKNREVLKPALPRYGTITSLLSAWLKYWKRSYTGFAVMGVGLYRTFSSVDELAKYLNSCG